MEKSAWSPVMGTALHISSVLVGPNSDIIKKRPPVSKKPTQVSFGFAQRRLKPFRFKFCKTAWKAQDRGADWGSYT